jgi:hypothetical protein
MAHVANTACTTAHVTKPLNTSVLLLLLLLLPCRVKVVVPREYNPRFEADFNAAADYDYDR